MEMYDYNINLNAQQERAFNLVKNSNFSFFLTGRAGTGKSTLLRYIRDNVKKVLWCAVLQVFPHNLWVDVR